MVPSHGQFCNKITATQAIYLLHLKSLKLYFKTLTRPNVNDGNLHLEIIVVDE